MKRTMLVGESADTRFPGVQALRVFADHFLAAHPSFASQVAKALLPHLLMLPTTGRVAVTALKVAKKVDHPLLRGEPPPTWSAESHAGLKCRILVDMPQCWTCHERMYPQMDMSCAPVPISCDADFSHRHCIIPIYS